MNVSARTEYACLAVLHLAARYGTDEPVRVAAIAESQGIPSHFLVQILLQLKGAGLVSSTRGAAGGYHLVRDPAAITLADVMRAMEGGDHQVTRSCNRETELSRALFHAWNDVALVQQEMLSSTTFQDLLERSASGAEQMYYI